MKEFSLPYILSIAADMERVAYKFKAAGFKEPDLDKVKAACKRKAVTTAYSYTELMNICLADLLEHGKQTNESKWIFE
jgi:hypothetical protein